MTAPLKLALFSGPGNGAGAGMRYVAGLVLFTLWCCVTRWLRCAAHLQLCGSGLEKQGPYAGNSFLISCPLRLVFEIFSFRFLPLPFSLLTSLSLLLAPDIYPLVPPLGSGLCVPSKSGLVAFFFFCVCLQRVSQLRSSHSDVSYGQKQTTFSLHPG